jgi:hypothetical protein
MEKKQRVNPFKHVEVAHCFTSPPMLVWSEDFSYHSKHWSPIFRVTPSFVHLVCSSRLDSGESDGFDSDSGDSGDSLEESIGIPQTNSYWVSQKKKLSSGVLISEAKTSCRNGGRSGWQQVRWDFYCASGEYLVESKRLSTCLGAVTCRDRNQKGTAIAFNYDSDPRRSRRRSRIAWET